MDVLTSYSFPTIKFGTNVKVVARTFQWYQERVLTHPDQGDKAKRLLGGKYISHLSHHEVEDNE